MELQQALESDKFEVSNLTASINNITAPKTRLAELGLFQERGISTTYVDIEYKDGQIILVPEKERGADGTHSEDRERKMYTFKAVHLPLEASIYADDIQNIRAFGSGEDGTAAELEQLDSLIEEKHEDHRLSLDVTIEYLRTGALFGKIIGARGTVIEDLYKRFEITAKDVYHDIDFTKDLQTQFLTVKSTSKKNQKGIKGKRYRVLCGPDFFNSMLENESFKKAFDRYENGAVLRDDVTSGVPFAGAFWELHDEEAEEDKPFLKPGEAAYFPEDKPGLFITRFCPANYNETVNTRGLPYYSRAEAKRMGKGVDIESQSNVINVCTNPLAVRRLKIKA